MNDLVDTLTLSKTQLKKKAALEHNEALRASLVEEAPLTNEQHAELEALSLEVFRSTSRYKTILKEGVVEAVTVEATEYVPAVLDADGKEVKAEETRTVQVPEKYRSPKRGLTTINQLKTVKHNYDSVKVLMLERKQQLDAFKAMMAKMEADKKATAEQEQLKKQVQRAVGGSAI